MKPIFDFEDILKENKRKKKNSPLSFEVISLRNVCNFVITK